MSVWRLLTSDDSRNAPAHGVVEPHVSLVDVAQLCQYAVDVQPFHKHPGKGAHVEVVEEDGDDGAHKLEEAGDVSVMPQFYHLCSVLNSKTLRVLWKSLKIKLKKKKN